MIIDIKTIQNTKVVEFSGDEDWLEFTNLSLITKTKSLGKVSLKPDEYEHCNVDGEIKI